MRRHPRPVVVCSAPLRLRRPRQVAVCLERRGERFRRAEARRWFIRRRAFDTRDGWWTLRRKHGCFYARGGRRLIRCLCSGHWRRVVWRRRSSAHAGRRVVRRRVLRGGDARVRWVRGIISGAHTRVGPSGIGRGVRRGGDASIDARRRPLWRVGASRGRRVVWCVGARGGSVPGGGLFGAAKPAGGGLFGAAPSTGGGLFGAAPSTGAAPGGGLFGARLHRLRRAEVCSVQRRRPVAACSAPLRRRLEAAFSVVVWARRSQRGCARSVRRATGGGDDSVRVAVAASSARARHDGARPCEAVFARKDAKSGRWRCGGRVSCAFAHASITVAHEPWWHQQRAEASRRVSVLSPGGAAQAWERRCRARDLEALSLSRRRRAVDGCLNREKTRARYSFVRKARPLADAVGGACCLPNARRTKPGASSSALRR